MNVTGSHATSLLGWPAATLVTCCGIESQIVTSHLRGKTGNVSRILYVSKWQQTV